MGNQVCSNCGASFSDPYEFNNHTRTCIVSKNTSEEEVNTSDINPLPTPSTSSTKHINNTRSCKLCYKI